MPAIAGAQVQAPAGSVHGSFMIGPSPDLAHEGVDLGAAALMNVWYPIGALRLGAFLGAGAVPSPNDARNRVFMPLGASIALELLDHDFGLSLRAYGGMWGGATQEVKLTAGGLIGGGAYFLYHLGAGVTLDIGADVWGFFGAGSQLIVAPSIGLSFGPAPQ